LHSSENITKQEIGFEERYR